LAGKHDQLTYNGETMGKRPRGFVSDYRPRAKNAALLEQVQAVLDEYRDYLPLTLRQVFYRLVGAYGHTKTEAAYKSLCEMLNLARRARLIPFDAIRDDGATVITPTLWDTDTDWLRAVSSEASMLRLNPWLRQPVYVELICEAGGMAPMLASVANPYGITVRSGGGFDSTTAKHELAQFYASQGKRVTVLHVGDYDASGETLWNVLDEDVGAFVDEMGGELRLMRVAVTPEQVREHDLPTAPPKDKDDRGDYFTDTITAQAEALPPALLQSIVRDAIESVVDLEQLTVTRELEQEARERLTQRLAGLLDD
jgi:hypothetical protein